MSNRTDVPTTDPTDDVPADELDQARVPVADKGDVARARATDASPADGLSSTPEGGEDVLENAAADGLVDRAPSIDELDFGDGTLPPETGTQDQSVAEAAVHDRGPADHLNPAPDPTLDR